MATNFTQEDLIRLLYGETDLLETHLIKQAMLQDMELQNAFLELKACKNELDSISFQPAQTSVDLILKHSRESQVMSY